MGELLRAELASKAKLILPKYYFSGFKSFDQTTVTTRLLSPIQIQDGSTFLMMGFVVTAFTRRDETVNSQDNFDILLELQAGASTYKYQYSPRQFMLENHSINAATDLEHYIVVDTPEQINLNVTNQFTVDGPGASILIGFTAYGEEYRF